MTKRVAIDVGGTFTDVCVLDEASGEIEVAKTPSTPDPIDGVIAGIRAASIDLADVSVFSHGTTVATNALLTRRLPRAALVTTTGFRDVIEIGRGWKNELWDAYRDVTSPYVQRRDRFEVDERVDYAGGVVKPLDENQARELARKLKRRGATTIAVCFINAHANADHERRMRTILEEEIDGVRVSISSEVLPEIFEHERFSTTVGNAVLAPLVSGYVNRLEGELRRDGYAGDLLILHSGGGVMTPRTVERLAVRLASSGIAAGAIASRHLAGLAGFDNAIGLDMGGTSTDISLVYAGAARVTKEWHVEWGHPICFPSIEVLTIGAGGGSLAWIDEAGSLRNGPESAGADPGPACYGKGGSQPTNTDANAVLGRLGEELLGGGMRLARDAAERAIQSSIADPLGLSTVEAAAAILQVANANMADAVRLISVRRGYDPREFALVVFGGAGPLHGAALADELSIPAVLVPPHPGVTSALGCLLVDIQHDLSTMYVGRVADLDVADLEEQLEKLEQEGRERLAAEGVAPEQAVIERTLDMRYVGQWRSISVAAPRPLASLEPAVRRFHEEHEREHNYRRDSSPVEVYRLNVKAIGEVPKPALARAARSLQPVPAPTATRQVYFDLESNPLATPVYQRATLRPGVRLDAPAIVEQLDSTVLIPPGWSAEVDEWLNIVLRREAAHGA